MSGIKIKQINPIYTYRDLTNNEIDYFNSVSSICKKYGLEYRNVARRIYGLTSKLPETLCITKSKDIFFFEYELKDYWCETMVQMRVITGKPLTCLRHVITKFLDKLDPSKKGTTECQYCGARKKISNQKVIPEKEYIEPLEI